MESPAVSMYEDRTAERFDATGSMRPLQLPTALLSKSRLGTDAFHMVINFLGCRGFGMAAPGTTLKGTVGTKTKCPSIYPIRISLRTFSEKTAAFVDGHAVWGEPGNGWFIR